jgi:hypothetical protein
MWILYDSRLIGRVIYDPAAPGFVITIIGWIG